MNFGQPSERRSKGPLCDGLMSGFAERSIRMAFALNREVENAGDREAVAALL